MKVLIIQTAFIGDVVLATPIIEKLYDYHPTSSIDFLLRKGNEGLLENHPKINEIIVWNKKRNKFKNLFAIIFKIRKKKYDLLINLHRFATTGLISCLSGAKIKVGFTKNPFSFCYQYAYPHTIENNTHEIVRNLQLIRKWTDHKICLPKLYLTDTLINKVKKYQSSPYIVLAPSSVWYTKQFPQGQWVSFLNKMIQNKQVYLIGSAEDYVFSQEIIDAAGKGINLCGQLSLMESVALIKDAEMNYVNDSAALHFASAVNAPTCAIFCSTVPKFGFGPLSKQSHIIETTEPLPCKPCGLHGKKHCPQGHFKCGKTIHVDRLIDLL